MHVIILDILSHLILVFLEVGATCSPLPVSCFCLHCIMVTKTAFSFVIIIIIIMTIMNIVTSVRVYPQEGTVETVSKFHLSCPLSASNLV